MRHAQAMVSARPRVSAAPRGVAVFQLERVLSCGPSVDVLLARALGHPEPAAESESRRERSVQRIQLARRYSAVPRGRLLSALSPVQLVAGAEQAVALLQRRAVVCAIASSSWDFVVELVAERLGIEHTLGTGFSRAGRVVHVWPEDIAEYPRRLASQLGDSALPHTLFDAQNFDLLPAAQQLVTRWAV